MSFLRLEANKCLRIRHTTKGYSTSLINIPSCEKRKLCPVGSQESTAMNRGIVRMQARVWMVMISAIRGASPPICFASA